MAGNDDTTAAGGGLVVITILGLDTSFLADVLKLLSIFVTANAAEVDGGVGREYVLAGNASIKGSKSDWEETIPVLLAQYSVPHHQR